MAYSFNSQITASREHERDLLLSGMTYPQVAEITGERLASIKERNRLVYKVDIWDAFKSRIARDGIPNRLNVSESFGYWFSGIIDGEGSFVIYTRERTDHTRYKEFRLSLRIQLRDDDTEAIQFIYDNLQIGMISHHGANGRTNPSIAWRVEKIQHTAEVIVPLFDKYPLHTKKAKEFAIWRDIVLQRYVDTLGGHSNRRGASDEYIGAFNQGIDAFNKIRTYTH